MEQTTEAKQQDARTAPRPPIVVVVGHIDHGKTSLLDYIRKTSVASREAGGITQAIGAYQAEHEGRKITFIDTPGHEAFSAMRRRGARVADIAVLVVAADEGVKPQTEEAIRVIREGEMPFAVAISKIDAPNADPARVKRELAEREVLVEGFGGTVPAVELSAKTGAGVTSLLETILLLADLEELTSDPSHAGEGVVVESHLDPKRGATATLLVEDGTVRRGEFVAAGGVAAPVRIFENFRGEAVETASAADPVRIVGFPSVPALGEPFRTFPTRQEAEEWAGRERDAARATPNEAAAEAASRQTVNIVLKADTLGSLEALASALEAVRSSELGNHLIKSDVGDINESDVKLAAATTHSFVAGFRVRTAPAIRELAERSGVTVVTSEIIYDLLESVRNTMLSLAPAELRRVDLGRARILARFREERGRQIVGGRIEEGKIVAGANFDIARNGVTIGHGRIIELQVQRRPAEEVTAGQEFGILAEAETTIAVGDTLSAFTEERVAPQL